MEHHLRSTCRQPSPLGTLFVRTVYNLRVIRDARHQRIKENEIVESDFWSLFFFFSRWNAARALAGFLQRNSDLYLGRNVLELGAGGGLPGLVTAKCGARKVRAFLACLAWRKPFLFWPR
jgi:nicotinamide N-methyltransferase